MLVQWNQGTRDRCTEKVFHKRIYLHDDVWRVHCGQIPHRRFCTAMTSEGERLCRVAKMPGGYTVTFSCRVVGKAALDQKFEWEPDIPSPLPTDPDPD